MLKVGMGNSSNALHVESLLTLIGYNPCVGKGGEEGLKVVAI